MMIKKITTLLFVCNLLFAGIGSDMTNFFNKFGAVTNSTKGSAFKDQQGGYYSGGSFFMRSPTRNTNPISVTPPGFRMGCGGIDIPIVHHLNSNDKRIFRGIFYLKIEQE